MPLALILSPRRRWGGVIQAKDDRPGGGEGLQQQAEQVMARGQRRPGRTIQHPMIILVARLRGQPTDAQSRGDGAFAGGENGPDQEHLGMLGRRAWKTAGQNFQSAPSVRQAR